MSYEKGTIQQLVRSNAPREDIKAALSDLWLSVDAHQRTARKVVAAVFPEVSTVYHAADADWHGPVCGKDVR